MIEWDDDIYSVGIKYIDEQHKVLVQLINAIEINRENSDSQFIEKIINTLVQYTKSHFRDEEQILKNIRYPSFNNHKDQHLRFEKSVTQFTERLHSSGDKSKDIDKLLRFLNDWLVSHILIEDCAYRDYFLEGVGVDNFIKQPSS
jgi:hemerythrin